jgi:hypothetical protein
MTARSRTRHGLMFALVATLGGAACLYQEDERCPAGYLYNDQYRACFCATAPRPVCPTDAAVVDAQPDVAGTGGDTGSDADAACDGGCPP